LNLPDFNIYKQDFLQQGITYPLKPVPTQQAGLLVKLPPPPAEKTGWPWTEQVSPDVYSKGINWPKLTIVTPSYNQGIYIEETLRAVLLQNYPNLEYIIIDGGSTDETKAILEKYSGYISYWQSEKDRGQSHAINLGFSLASGEYYAWINSDDFYMPGVFHEVISKFLSSKTAFIYGYAYDLRDGKNTLIRIPPSTDYFIKIPSLMQPSCFWRASIHQPIWEEMHCAMDYELWLRLLKGNSRLRIRKPLSVARAHADAKTYDPKMQARWQADHERMWADDAHGSVPEWKRITFLNKLRLKLYKFLHII